MLLSNFLELFLESAPWLLLGLVLAGLLKVFVPMAWMQKQLGGHGLKTVVKAAVIGAPLPLCSCGVIPAAVGLRRSGASKAATTSFLVSTPETGVDSVTVSYVLLGPFMAIVRPIAAITSAIVAGLLVGRDDDDGKVVSEVKDDAATNTATNTATTTAMTMKPAANASVMQPMSAAVVKSVPVAKASSCCASKSESVKAEASSCCASKSESVKAEATSCCSSKSEAAKEEKSGCCSSETTSAASEESCCASTQDMATELKQETILSRIFTGLKYAATDLVRDTTLWLLVGLFFAALVQTYVPTDFLAKWGDGILAMLVMVLISVPMYICATASTPIAAGLLLAGVSPGAVLVFMMAGPATNIATLGVVAKELGKRALFGYLGGVLGVALVAGILVNYLVAEFGFVVMPQIGEHHELLPHWLVLSSGIVLAVLMAKVVWDKLPKMNIKRDCCS
ncbi:SO_0444 family Cu/Zn efflux transporter [Shewanella sp. 5_MG-2023]|uniref:SO_0444 family Cu/Zn efflux transporter n=1 Tax=Shewanella sp. 5_MG-2023 TaxID=3062656 RepID=UPI0026E3E8AD|nr:SO_0444 family Cu/Zn efflux transporter [Shewanella sp. 5_MG-2023]MDO6642086.1 SO_0444 family Cu/Zn efflux transporter [Shewanella sp. 5_MG-2023]